MDVWGSEIEVGLHFRYVYSKTFPTDRGSYGASSPRLDQASSCFRMQWLLVTSPEFC